MWDPYRRSRRKIKSIHKDIIIQSVRKPRMADTIQALD